MQAIEFPFVPGLKKIIEIPDQLKKRLKPRQKVRVILLVEEPEEYEVEKEGWNNLVAEQFLDGYHRNDSVYDNILMRIAIAKRERISDFRQQMKV